MIVSKTGEDRIALDALRALVGPRADRRALSLAALDKIATLQTNLEKLPMTDEVQSVLSGLIDETLIAVEVVLANRGF